MNCEHVSSDNGDSVKDETSVHDSRELWNEQSSSSKRHRDKKLNKFISTPSMDSMHISRYSSSSNRRRREARSSESSPTVIRKKKKDKRKYSSDSEADFYNMRRTR